MTFIHRADRIDALLGEIAGRAGEVVVYPLWPGEDRPASRHPGARPQAGRGAGAARPRAGVARADGRPTGRAEGVLREGRGIELLSPLVVSDGRGSPSETA